MTDRSCSKISCLVKVYPAGHRDKAVKLYAILDELSNRSLFRSQFFEVFSDQSPSAPYTLRACAGVKESAGRRASGYQVESLDGTVRIPLPSLTECNDITNNRDEILTPNVDLHHAHLKSVAYLIPDIDPQSLIMLLLGWDIIRVHKVCKQVNGSHNLPYAQKLDLGWVIVGNVCLGSIHKPAPSTRTPRSYDALLSLIDALTCSVSRKNTVTSRTPSIPQHILRRNLDWNFAQLADLISAELDLPIDSITYYSDSKVVLGYIYHETRHIYVNVSNQVLHI